MLCTTAHCMPLGLSQQQGKKTEASPAVQCAFARHRFASIFGQHSTGAGVKVQARLNSEQHRLLSDTTFSSLPCPMQVCSTQHDTLPGLAVHQSCYDACGHVQCQRAKCLFRWVLQRAVLPSALLPTPGTTANSDHHMHAGRQPVAGSRTQGCPRWPALRGPAAAASCGSTRLVPWSARPSSPGPPRPSAAPPAEHSGACVVRCPVLGRPGGL